MSDRAERLAAALTGRVPVLGATLNGGPGEGYERPAVIPPDPSDVAARNY
jgi:hypothetical protein